MPVDPFQNPFGAPSGLDPKDIFARPRGGGFRAPKKQEQSPEEEVEALSEDEGEESEAREEKVSKDNVILRNPKWEMEKVGFNEETEISVEAELPKSQAHKTRVEFELFAETPNGPERIAKGQGNIESGRAICKIPVYIPQFKDEFGNLLDKVKYFFTAKHSASDPLKDEAVAKEVKELADRLLECHILQDITFATGKSQVEPKHAPALKDMAARIKEWKKKHPDGKMAIFGHADAVGREDENKKVSERRAKAIFAFLVKDADLWNALYDEEKWGLASTQELLKHLGHDPGAIDGKEGPKTQAAVKAFQSKKGLAASGTADAATRTALYEAFMGECNPEALVPKDFDSLNGKPHAGCSEFNLVEKVEGSSETNRRVAVVLLKSNRNFPIQYPCKQGDIAPCKKQVGRKGERRTAGFGCLFYDQLVVENGGGNGSSHSKVGALKLVGIKEGETLKQYVNLEPGKPEEGSERRIEVVVEGAADGTKVFWKAKAGKDNSKRSSPKPGLKMDSQGDFKGFVDSVAELETEVKAGKAACLLVCGLAGGNTYEVEMGLEKGTCTSKFNLVTWRKLWYETIQPEAYGKNPVTGFTVFKADKSSGLSENSKSYLSRVLGDGFVELDQLLATNFGMTDLPASGKFNVFDGAYAGKKAGERFSVLTFLQLDELLASKAKLAKNKRSISIIWTDYLAKMVDWEESFSLVSMAQSSNTEFQVFESAVDSWGDFSHGQLAIKTLKWRATHWMDPDVGDWVPIRTPQDAGWSHRNATVFSNPEDIRAHVGFKEMGKLSFNFPSGKQNYPGNLFSKDSEGRFMDQGKYIALTLVVKGVACTTQINGAALEGNIWMNTFAGTTHDIGLAGVIAHELGHNMGQAYADSSVDAKFGRPDSKPIPGIPFPPGVPMGKVYGEHGHRGTHCADGVKDRTAFDFRDESKSNALAEHTCLMFGASDMADAKEFRFCGDCLTYMRAENLENIRKSWNS